MKKLLGVILLAGCSMASGVAYAQDHHRYYDRDRHDWHEWNEAENRAYRHWLMEERHEHRFREYQQLKAQQQREYWRWRHDHGDRR